MNITPLPSSTTTTILLISTLLLLRTLISLHPHSGQNNHHGSTIAYGGDYEAQRHWMELTLHLPLSQWYTYDPSYWGLDYPPLSAYGSYAIGWVSHYVVGPESVALGTSRGYEDTIHKAFLRGSVLVLDGIYIGAVWILAKRVVGGTTKNKDGMVTDRSMASFGIVVGTALAQPSLILIDHGHFQYNSVCLGLSLLSFHYLSNGDGGGDATTAIGTNAIIGSILFCLALNWKQMGLYYAPAVFSYLLGRCCSSTSSNFPSGATAAGWGWWFRQFIKRLSVLGFTVLSTFGILLTPFIYYRDASSQTIGDVLLLILRRIFPFQRGLFEGKVSNLWCMLSVKPLSIRDRIPQEYQPIVALGVTMGLALPFCVVLFKVGSEGHRRDDGETTTMATQRRQQRHLKALLWGSAGTSLSFFLASFQVHEKSILLPLAPLSLLIMEAPTFIIWVSLVATWSLWHLLQMDRLQVPYVCISVLFCVVVRACFAPRSGGGSIQPTKTRTNEGCCSVLARWGSVCFTTWLVPASFVGMAGLHLMELLITPPSHMPDIFPVLWVIEGCSFFCVTWIGILYFVWLEYNSDRGKGVVTDTSTSTSRLKQE